MRSTAETKWIDILPFKIDYFSGVNDCHLLDRTPVFIITKYNEFPLKLVGLTYKPKELNVEMKFPAFSPTFR